MTAILPSAIRTQSPGGAPDKACELMAVWSRCQPVVAGLSAIGQNEDDVRSIGHAVRRQFKIITIIRL